MTFDGERRKLIVPTSQSQHKREPAWSCNSGGLFSFPAYRYVFFRDFSSFTPPRRRTPRSLRNDKATGLLGGGFFFLRASIRVTYPGLRGHFVKPAGDVA